MENKTIKYKKTMFYINYFVDKKDYYVEVKYHNGKGILISFFDYDYDLNDNMQWHIYNELPLSCFENKKEAFSYFHKIAVKHIKKRHNAKYIKKVDSF